MSHTDSSLAAEESDLDPQAVDYKPVSLWAVMTFVLGLASSLTLAGPVLLFIPGLAVLSGLLALRSIAASGGAVVGRKPVLWGITLAVFFTAMSVSQVVAERKLLERDARQLADTFLHLLQTNQPQKAHQLQFAENRRQPPGTSLWRYYQTTPNDYEGLKTFVDAPLVRALLELGEKATVRYYATEEIATAQGRSYISLLYTVTYEDRGRRKTFFARISLRRDVDAETNLLDWSVDNYEGGAKPFVASKWK